MSQNHLSSSELILNEDLSVYHLHLKPEDISNTIITVGDPARVKMISDRFDRVDIKKEYREFVTHTGYLEGKRLTVISTGIGTDNIDIVINELDALVNIDLEKRVPKKTHTSLNIVRIGTSGSLQKDIPVDSFVLAKYGLGLDGMLLSYDCKNILETAFEEAFIKHTNWHPNKARPYVVKNSQKLEDKLSSKKVFKGVTATAGGFYGPQGRVLRLSIQDPQLNTKIDSFEFNGTRITNLEMETSAIYGLSKLLGHHACSMNAIIANRANGAFSEDPYKPVEELIIYSLDKLCN